LVDVNAVDAGERVIEQQRGVDHVEPDVLGDGSVDVSQAQWQVEGAWAPYSEPGWFEDQHFWARGYFVSTVGRDEAVVREYIRHQEQEDHRQEQVRFT
jgi:hypothetical protein